MNSMCWISPPSKIQSDLLTLQTPDEMNEPRLVAQLRPQSWLPLWNPHAEVPYEALWRMRREAGGEGPGGDANAAGAAAEASASSEGGECHMRFVK